MDPELWREAQAVFHRLCGLPADRQMELLRAECGEKQELYEEVLEMLRADRDAVNLLDQGLGDAAAELLLEDAPDQGRRIGHYRLERVLGEGGMGTVFLATRDDLDAKVAIKVLRNAWISPSRRRRFSLEQRLLSRLDHPHIVRLLDAGALADGTPYFVMEYVDGVPMHIACQQHSYSIRKRLELFQSVCEAVQFAHRHAVIHRDLKPTNILVRPDGAVKLLDFGIAKHVEENADLPAATRTGLRLLTPAYASPEQLRGEPAAITSDVYSLGVILYQLLTDRLPFDPTRRKSAETEAPAQEREPVRPSMVARRVRPDESLNRSQWADLDVLCLKAMHKDAGQRYPSVEALLRDIGRYLLGETLEARPDTWSYRLSRFVRRRRRTVAAALLTAAMLAVLAAAFTVRLAVERNAALAEAARAARMQRFVLSLFEGGDKEAGPANGLMAATLIDRGVQEARSLGHDPAAQSEMFQTLGGIYRKLGDFERAQELYGLALGERRQRGTPALLSESLIALGLLRLDQARLEEAERLVREGLALAEKTLPPTHPAIASAADALGQVLEEKGAYEEAVPVLERAVRLRSGGEQASPDLASSLLGLASVHFYAGRYRESEALNQQALAQYRRLYGDRHPAVAETLANLGAIQHDLGNYRDAERLHRRALEITAAYFGNEHYRTAASMTMLARALVFQKRLDEAAVLLQQALAIRERVYGPVSRHVASTLNESGTIHLMQGRLAEAQAAFERLIRIYRTVYSGKHYLIGLGVANLGSTYMAGKAWNQAERCFREALSMFQATLPPEHLHIAIARIKLGRTLLRQRRYAEAEAETSAGREILKQQANPEVSWLQSAESDLAEISKARQPARASR